MRSIITLGIAAAALLVASTAGPAAEPAQAAARTVPTDCTELDGEWVQGPELEFFVVSDATVPGSVRVPPDTPCAFIRTTIDGDLIVKPDGPEPVPTVALLEGGNHVTGVVRAHRNSAAVLIGSTVSAGAHCLSCDFVDAYDSVINGDVTSLRAGGAVLQTTTIHGDVRLVAARQPTTTGEQPFIDIADSAIDGALTLIGNRGAPDSILVRSTSVEGDLRCIANDPAPTTESVRVNGHTLGQCSTQPST